jgi:predicted RNA-binding protein associated with RNAse of E/G family
MTITIIKNDHTGRETWRYTGQVIARGASWVQLEAIFNRPDLHTPYHTFRRGDRFVEWYFSDRWYNIFEMHAVDDDRITGWYCNITRPAVLGEDTIYADDLALDVFVGPAGTIAVLDKDEFAALPLDEYTRAQVQAALAELLRLVETRQPPFDAIQF